MDSNQLISDVAYYVRRLFNEEVKSSLYFHNLSHTENVVTAAEEIGMWCDLDKNDMNIVKIAGWFHDTGYAKIYNGHEAISAQNAFQYLKGMRINKATTTNITNCILATQIPQRPNSSLEEIVCDADFYHLSRPDYFVFAKALRLEWETELKLLYSDEEWDMLNLEMLSSHQYFTPYGQTILQQRKEQHIMAIKKRYNLD